MQCLQNASNFVAADNCADAMLSVISISNLATNGAYFAAAVIAFAIICKPLSRLI